MAKKRSQPGIDMNRSDLVIGGERTGALEPDETLPEVADFRSRDV